ncbi:TIGR01212 family radical SAM protein [Desulfovibrio sp. JC010]|uniref:TIGR01212 family radical SAM protein n=1 Tax=Desulfovibrio sp. JC010 TaxID=2593641 RepID=UPI0013D3D335|nr:TIGR01212 family radical SAM protein [Desulfovibrio sp. JC010]NDV27030.1 TIGR01212 family radical SAM protein [Desulfovibrio sp. JC010]
MHRFYGLAARLRQSFGERVQKIPLDFGFTCPNRDGHLSRKGCIFCSPQGSGSGLHKLSMSIPEQWAHWQEKLSKLYTAKLYLAYLQSYSNTYCSIDELKCALEQLEGLPGLAGLCIGTRPDCLDDEKLVLIKNLGLKETWIDLGLQSSNNQTLERINRGHTAEQFAEAVHMAHAHGLDVCAHLIAGLPGESTADFLESVRFLNELPIAGIKFHNLFVGKGTPLKKIYDAGEYTPIGKDEYIAALVQAISILRTDIVIHRLKADAIPGGLIAPEWVRQKRKVLNEIEQAMKAQGVWQGCARDDAPDEPPLWYSAEHKRETART